MANTFLAPVPRGVAALVPVSDDKTQITLLILGQGALSTQTSHAKRLQAKLRDFFSFPPSQLIIAALQVVSIQKEWGNIGKGLHGKIGTSHKRWNGTAEIR